MFNKLWYRYSKVTQSCPTLCDPTDCSPAGSSVHGILQARTLEWVAVSFSRGSSRPRDQTWVFLYCRQTLYRLNHQGSPKLWYVLIIKCFIWKEWSSFEFTNMKWSVYIIRWKKNVQHRTIFIILLLKYKHIKNYI